MIQVRKSTERGHLNHGWLDTYHTFSFGDYHDPQHMGFHTLRVINEDVVEPGKGFPTHSHHDMEILTYILSGALEHKDSLGNTSVIRPGELQRMSAGSGVRHSEYNASQKEPVHLLQIWIQTEKKGINPGYEQKDFSDSDRLNAPRLLASRDGRHQSLTIYQDVNVYDLTISSGQTFIYNPGKDRRIWVQMISGTMELNEHALSPGDGAGIFGESELIMQAGDEATLLIFDLG